MSSEKVVGCTIPEQKKAKRFIVFWTALFVMLFPFSLILSSYLTFIFLFILSQVPQFSLIASILIPVSILSVPSSILGSIWKMWSKYKEGKYREACRYFSWPLYVFLIIFILDAACFTGTIYLAENQGNFRFLKFSADIQTSLKDYIRHIYHKRPKTWNLTHAKIR